MSDSLGTRHFPNFLDAYLEWCSNVNGPSNFVKFGGLFAISAALERKTWIRFKNGMHCHPNCYFIIVGPPGIRKSSSTKKAVSLIKSVEGLVSIPESVTAAALIKTMEEVNRWKSVEIGNRLYPNTSCFWYVSELIIGVNQAENSGNIVEILTDLYECGPDGWSEQNNCWSKRTLSGGEIRLFNPCLNLLACSTPEWLVRGIGRENIDSGFASRCLYIYSNQLPADEVGWAETGDYSNIKADATFFKLSRDLAVISRIVGEYIPDTSYKKAFDLWQKSNNEFMRDNPKHKFIGYYNRKPWHIMKLSQIVRAAESNELTLTARHFLQAKAIVEAEEQGMQLSFRNLGKTNDYENLEVIWGVMKKLRIFTRRQLQVETVHLMSRKALSTHLETMIDLGKVRLCLKEGNKTITYEVCDFSDLRRKGEH